MAGVEARPLLTALTFRVRTYDIDFAGIVSNLVYLRWLEDLRGEKLAAHYPAEVMRTTGIGPVLLHTDIDYRRALRLGDSPLGRMWVAEMRRTRWLLQAEFLMGAEVVCDARQSGAFVEYARLRPVPVPEPLRRAWQVVGAK